jgi:hypothetical protein
MCLEPFTIVYPVKLAPPTIDIFKNQQFLHPFTQSIPDLRRPPSRLVITCIKILFHKPRICPWSCSLAWAAAVNWYAFICIIPLQIPCPKREFEQMYHFEERASTDESDGRIEIEVSRYSHGAQNRFEGLRRCQYHNRSAAWVLYSVP